MFIVQLKAGELNPSMASLNLKGCMAIPDDFEGYPKDLFMIPKHYESSVESVLIPGGVIQVSQSLALALAVINEHNRVFVPFRMRNCTSCFACHSADKALQHCVQILLQLRLFEHYTGKSISMLVFGPMNYNQTTQPHCTIS